MENNNAAKASNNNSNNNNNGEKSEDQNPSNGDSNGSSREQVAAPQEGTAADGGSTGGNRSRRTPFTDLSQEEADLALARTLQEQERAYMMLRMNADGVHYGSWGAASYGYEDEDEDEEDEDFDDPSEEYDGSNADEDGEDDEEDAFDVHTHVETGEDEHQGIELDPSAYSSDEAYARALQDAEERDMAARLLALAGINEVFAGGAEDDEDHSDNSQDGWEEADPDELSYEELIALGEVVGTESRGLSANTIASLPSVNYKSQSTQDGSIDSCVICRSDYEDGETLTVLSCKHSYHSECINNWLQQNKVCPICNTEVSTSANS